MVKSLRFVAVVIVIAILLALSPRGRHSRREFVANLACCDFSLLQSLRLTAREAITGVTYPSEIGQDKWVAVKIFPGVHDGYFLDVGSGDGTIGSNTKALEDTGWNGICVDPFPTHMEGRRCAMVRQVVSDVPGKVVRFHTHQGLGGIADTLGKWKEEASKSPVAEFTTTTLGQILDEAHAPAFIHFLSLDIEGAEFDALKGLPFDRYTFGAMAIEHNEEEPKRTNILTFLTARGYRRVHSYKQDDFYTR